MKNRKLIYGVGIAVLLYFLFRNRKVKKAEQELVEAPDKKDNGVTKEIDETKKIVTIDDPVAKVLVLEDIKKPKPVTKPKPLAKPKPLLNNYYSYSYTKVYSPVVLRKRLNLKSTSEAKKLIAEEVKKGNIWARNRHQGEGKIGAVVDVDFVPNRGTRCGSGKDKLNPCR